MDGQKELALSSYSFGFDPSLIAREPAKPRDHSKLLVMNRSTGSLEHRRFDGIIEFLRAGDVLVVNESRVIPARLCGESSTGGRIEILLVEKEEGGPEVWTALMKGGGGGRPGQRLHFSVLQAEVLERVQSPTGATVRIRFDGNPLDHGQTPLPPYISKGRTAQETDSVDYQTVYAAPLGSSAAPTAGLHFTENLIQAIKHHGVSWLTVNHRIGPGTFRPVEANDLRDHAMHEESYEIAPDVLFSVQKAKAEGRRVIAVGTSAVRALESAAKEGFRPGAFRTRLWIHPGFEFRVIDAMVTNFHQPESPPLIMTCAFGGRANILAAYRVATKAGYRFFSFGDAMFIHSDAQRET